MTSLTNRVRQFTAPTRQAATTWTQQLLRHRLQTGFLILATALTLVAGLGTGLGMGPDTGLGAATADAAGYQHWEGGWTCDGVPGAAYVDDDYWYFCEFRNNYSGNLNAFDSTGQYYYQSNGQWYYLR